MAKYLGLKTAQQMIIEMHDSGLSEERIARFINKHLPEGEAINQIQIHRNRVRDLDPRFKTWAKILKGYVAWSKPKASAPAG